MTFETLNDNVMLVELSGDEMEKLHIKYDSLNNDNEKTQVALNLCFLLLAQKANALIFIFFCGRVRQNHSKGKTVIKYIQIFGQGIVSFLSEINSSIRLRGVFHPA